MTFLEEATQKLESKFVGDLAEIEAKNGRKFKVLRGRNANCVATYQLYEVDGIVDLMRGKFATLEQVAEWLLQELKPQSVVQSNPQKAPAGSQKESTNLYRAFAVAMNNIKHPKLRIDDYTFSPAKPNSANPGAVYVKAGGVYLGKYIAEGRFISAGGHATNDDIDRIEEIAKDPLHHAKIHGIKYGKCSVCNRDLTDPESIEAGIGPICASNFGF